MNFNLLFAEGILMLSNESLKFFSKLRNIDAFLQNDIMLQGDNFNVQAMKLFLVLPHKKKVAEWLIILFPISPHDNKHEKNRKAKSYFEKYNMEG